MALTLVITTELTLFASPRPCSSRTPVTNHSESHQNSRPDSKPRGGIETPPGTKSASVCRLGPKQRESLHGFFFASLSIYELPLHVIYTGLMIMLFIAETASRDPLGCLKDCMCAGGVMCCHV